MGRCLEAPSYRINYEEPRSNAPIGRKACYEDGGEDADAEVGLCRERGLEVLQLEHLAGNGGKPPNGFEPRPSGTNDHHLTVIPGFQLRTVVFILVCKV